MNLSTEAMIRSRRRMSGFRYMTGNVSNFRLEATFKEHMAIVEPCLKGDWEKAKEQLIYHLEQSKASAFRLVAQSNPGFLNV